MLQGESINGLSVKVGDRLELVMQNPEESLPPEVVVLEMAFDRFARPVPVSVTEVKVGMPDGSRMNPRSFEEINLIVLLGHYQPIAAPTDEPPTDE